MNVQVIEQPPFEPVTMAEVYNHLRLDPDGSPLEHVDDVMLRGFIAAARQFVEGETGRALVRQRLRLTASAFGALAGWPGGVRLLRPPVATVLAVSYFDGQNLRQDLDAADWYVADTGFPLLRTPVNFVTPEAYGRPDAVTIDYIAGYPPVGSPPLSQEDYIANVPPALKTAVLLGVQLLYDNLAADQRDRMERTQRALLAPFRVMVMA